MNEDKNITREDTQPASPQREVVDDEWFESDWGKLVVAITDNS